MANRKKEDKVSRPIRPAEAIAREFNEPGAGLPLEDAALVLGDDGKPVEHVEEQEAHTLSPASSGRLMREAVQSSHSGGDDISEHVRNTGSGVETTAPGGPGGKLHQEPDEA